MGAVRRAGSGSTPDEGELVDDRDPGEVGDSARRDGRAEGSGGRGPGVGEACANACVEPPLLRRLRRASASIPEGMWASYGDVAAAIGTGARAVGTMLATGSGFTGAHRILRADGTVSEGFRWADDGDDRDPRSLLAAEGVVFTGAGRAARICRMEVDELRALISAPSPRV
nr:MGMT family protein [Corynebacterium meridianum]